MAPPRDAISVRTARLNNLIIGKGVANGGIPLKASERRSTIAVATVSPAVAEAITREGLLDALCLLYNECDNEALKRRDRNIADFVNKFRHIIEETRQLRVSVDDFNVKTLIGKGYFGNVYLVVERQTHDVYAMKKIKKSVVTASQVKEERTIMSRRCSEWITNLQYAFQDADNLYLIMEFLPGGDLLALMTRHGPFDEDIARFYLAELCLAIHALHAMGYVHRDIKPENILIDRFGHIKLADFGNAAALDRDGHVFSLSPVGTPDYIAPELLQTISTYKLRKNVHDVSCDYWSMGIIAYEMIYETTPFHEENVHETYSKILSHCDDSQFQEIVVYPSDLKVSENFKSLIGSLVTSPKNRLVFEKIKEHHYFESIKWETLRSQVPPIIPSLKGEDDTSNFEDIERSKGRTSVPVTKPLSTNIKSNEFSGKDLPFIGYSFVHMEKKSAADEGDVDNARCAKLMAKLKEFQRKVKDRSDEITKLKQEQLRAEQVSLHSNSQSKILQDAKEEINKMKDIIKQKTMELAACRTQVKTLQRSIKIDEEMWQKKEATITDLLRVNRQKYEEAKLSAEQRYEREIGEKMNEISDINQKLVARESELCAKAEECTHLQAKTEKYKEMLRQFKEQAQMDKIEFEKNKTQLSEHYEQRLADLLSRLHQEKESKLRMNLELNDMRAELGESNALSRNAQQEKNEASKCYEEIGRRLKREIEAKCHLEAEKAELEKKVIQLQQVFQKQQHEIARLERELKLAECSKSLAECSLVAQSSPYETAPGSLTELRDVEEQLRVDLERAKEGEDAQRARADSLQAIITKLEAVIEKLNEKSTTSSTEASSTPHHLAGDVGDLLEKQNEKLEDKLALVREQMIVERQAARTANLALWKVEKRLDEALAENKLIKRRMELTDERVKKVQAERDETKSCFKMAQVEVRMREERIVELKRDIDSLKCLSEREHALYVQAEKGRLNAKAQLVEQISENQLLDGRISDIEERLKSLQHKCDALSKENNRLINELNEERGKCIIAQDSKSALDIEMKKLQHYYDLLKHACSLTDRQLSEVETMLNVEQQRSKAKQEQIDQLNATLLKKEETISQLKKDLNEEQVQKRAEQSRINALSGTINENKAFMNELEAKLNAQNQQLEEQSVHLFEAQERIEVLSNEVSNAQALNENLDREMNVLKEENCRILSELFYSKEKTQQLEADLKEAEATISDLHTEIDELQLTLNEKEQYYKERDVKAEATLAQHKKLIDYLQLKVEDLSQKKKKTLADKLFGTTPSKKDTISPSDVESSILYRTLQAELHREKKQNKILQEQIDKLSGTTQAGTKVTTPKSPAKSKKTSEEKENVDSTAAAKLSSNTLSKSSSEQPETTSASATVAAKTKDCSKGAILKASTFASTEAHHRFELVLPETNNAAHRCVVCKIPIVAGSPCWKCKECHEVVHRKCRTSSVTHCNAGGTSAADNEQALKASTPITDSESAQESDAASVGKYSYEGKLDTVDNDGDVNPNINGSGGGDYMGKMILCTETDGTRDPIIVNCAYEMEEQKILMLGCTTGLIAYHVETERLVRIAGLSSVESIDVCITLAKAIMVGSQGESLYQCDYRHLLSRCQASASLRPALTASAIDLSFANRPSDEKFKFIKISNETEDPLETVAIATTVNRVVILKYDLNIQKFKPVRALDTASPVSSILFTKFTAIVASDKFFEIDMDDFAAEEFVDLSDRSLAHTPTCQPIVAQRISSIEFLLCYRECGIFVDAYGCRSRPYELNWEYAPTQFVYRGPLLYVAHFQSVQIMRVHRSYSQELTNADSEQELLPDVKRVYLPLYMPTLLANSGELNMYSLALQKYTGVQKVYLIDAKEAFKQKQAGSVETLSSVATINTVQSSVANGN